MSSISQVLTLAPLAVVVFFTIPANTGTASVPPATTPALALPAIPFPNTGARASSPTTSLTILRQYYGGFLGMVNGDSQFMWSAGSTLLHNTRDANRSSIRGRITTIRTPASRVGHL